MDEKIKLKRDGHGDSRTAPKDTTQEQFHNANISHISDVRAVMLCLARKLAQQGNTHDWTKLRYEDEFWNDFWNNDFVNGVWYQRHVHTERHHPTSYCHEDINLLDIVEMIVDCVCAGKARSGEIRQMEISDEILKKAFDNTVKLVDCMTETD